MESYSEGEITRKLLHSGMSLFTSKTLHELLEIENERTYYRMVASLIQNNVLKKIERNKYVVLDTPTNSFEVANFLYQPSYISLESALNYWGILSQFPYEVTSVTLKKSISKEFEDKIYSYAHIASRNFGMFTKKDSVLIAVPEKALFDQLYLASKGLKSSSFSEYNLDGINRKRFAELCTQLHASETVLQLAKKIIK